MKQTEFSFNKVRPIARSLTTTDRNVFSGSHGGIFSLLRALWTDYLLVSHFVPDCHLYGVAIILPL